MRGIEGLTPRDKRRLEKIKAYIEINLEKDLKIKTLALDFGIGESTLRRQFRQHFGKTFHAFVLECRMKNAMELLTSRAASVKEIAAKVGYKKRSAFTHFFTRYFGHPPLYYFDAP